VAVDVELVLVVLLDEVALADEENVELPPAFVPLPPLPGAPPEPGDPAVPVVCVEVFAAPVEPADALGWAPPHAAEVAATVTARTTSGAKRIAASSATVARPRTKCNLRKSSVALLQ
jgi:hypothetical protein